jgi:phosphatidate cytidylyltransferase
MMKRIISSAVGLPLILWILCQGKPTVVLVFFASIQFLLALEIMRLFMQGLPLGEPVFLSFSGATWGLALLATVIFGVLIFSTQDDTISLLAFFLLGAAVLSTLLPGPMDIRCQRAQSVLLALFYSIVPWLMIAALYEKAENERLVILLLSIAWAGDTAAYFFGKTWGRHKMAPMISPHKTWIGALAGLIGSMIAAGLASQFYDGQLGSWPYMLGVGAACALAGQAGDLFKSAFKRARGVKDSGQLIPGHGGLLDRMDSALMSAPLLNLFF